MSKDEQWEWLKERNKLAISKRHENPEEILGVTSFRPLPHEMPARQYEKREVKSTMIIAKKPHAKVSTYDDYHTSLSNPSSPVSTVLNLLLL